MVGRRAPAGTLGGVRSTRTSNHMPDVPSSVSPADPLKCPVGLLLHAVDGVDGAEEAVLLRRVADVELEHQRVHLCGRK